MSTPLAKKRRIDTASQTLSKPFRSPFKTPFKSPLKGAQTRNNTSATSTPTSRLAKSTILVEKNVNTPNLCSGNVGSTPVGPRKTKRTFNGPVAAATLNNDPEIASLLKVQRELEKELRGVKESVDEAEQAKKIEEESRRKWERDVERGDQEGEWDGEVDGELVILCEKWKGASRLAAEELFGRVRDRVNRMGGPRAWKEMQKKQQEFQNEWQQGEQNSNNDSGEEDNEGEVEKRDLYAEYDIDPETENEKSQRAKGAADTGERPGEEDEFTMAMMLRTLNVDLDIIGYDRDQQRWLD